MRHQCLRKISTLLLAAALVLVLVAPSRASEKSSAGRPSAKANGGSAAACLKCHGPFEKLASAPPSYVLPGGEKVTPHRYVPHDLKEIPDCVSCHQPHSAVPTKAEIAVLPRPNVKTCFSCHHMENFARCKTCH